MSAVAEVKLVDRFGNDIGSLDDAEVQTVTWNLDDVGAASIAVPTTSKVGSEIELMKTEWQVWIGGNLEWQGFAESISGDSALLTYTLADLLGYFAYRFVTNTSIQYLSTEQVDIAENFIAAMQSGTNQSFNIMGAGVGASGQIRDRTYAIADHQNAIDVLKEFPTLNNGFDFSVECTDARGIPGRFFTPWYPNKGSYKPQYALVWGKNVLEWNSFAEDGTKLSTINYTTGGSDGVGGKFENHYEDLTASNYYGQFQSITSDGDELDPQWLLSYAAQQVGNRNRPLQNPTAVIADVAGENLVHNLKVGDTVPVYVSQGRIFINITMRVMQAVYNADTTYSLLLAPVPLPFTLITDNTGTEPAGPIRGPIL